MTKFEFPLTIDELEDMISRLNSELEHLEDVRKHAIDNKREIKFYLFATEERLKNLQNESLKVNNDKN